MRLSIGVVLGLALVAAPALAKSAKLDRGASALAQAASDVGVRMLGRLAQRGPDGAVFRAVRSPGLHALRVGPEWSLPPEAHAELSHAIRPFLDGLAVRLATPGYRLRAGDLRVELRVLGRNHLAGGGDLEWLRAQVVVTCAARASGPEGELEHLGRAEAKLDVQRASLPPPLDRAPAPVRASRELDLELLSGVRNVAPWVDLGSSRWWILPAPHSALANLGDGWMERMRVHRVHFFETGSTSLSDATLWGAARPPHQGPMIATSGRTLLKDLSSRPGGVPVTIVAGGFAEVQGDVDADVIALAGLAVAPGARLTGNVVVLGGALEVHPSATLVPRAGARFQVATYVEPR